MMKRSPSGMPSPAQRLVESVGKPALLFRREATGGNMEVENRHFRVSALAMSWVWVAILPIRVYAPIYRFDKVGPFDKARHGAPQQKSRRPDMSATSDLVPLLIHGLLDNGAGVGAGLRRGWEPGRWRRDSHAGSSSVRRGRIDRPAAGGAICRVGHSRSFPWR
jgi:hypothetical protein